MSTLQGTGIVGCSNYLKNTLIPSVSTIRVSNIFDYEPTDLAGYPACTITSQEVLGKAIDNARNERIYRFTIRIFIDRNVQNFGVNTAESLLRTIADEVISKIDTDLSLGGNCIYTTVFPAKFGYIDRQSNNIRLMEIQLDCHDAITYK